MKIKQTQLVTTEKIESDLNSLLDRKATKKESNTFLTIAKIESIDSVGSIWLQVDGQNLKAISLVSLDKDAVGSSCAVQFIDGNSDQPLVLGLIKNNASGVEISEKLSFKTDENNGNLLISADQEIVFQCGESYLRMTSEGVVEIRGLFVSTDAIVTNRIRGGSVQVN